MVRQDMRCALCNATFAFDSKLRAVVDHDHATWAGAGPALLEKAAAYLRRKPKVTL